jgi:hypothetical protein
METNLRYVLEATSLGSCGSRTRLLTGSKHQERTETAPRRPHQHFIHPDAAQQHHDCCAEPQSSPRYCATEPGWQQNRGGLGRLGQCVVESPAETGTLSKLGLVGVT